MSNLTAIDDEQDELVVWGGQSSTGKLARKDFLTVNNGTDDLVDLSLLGRICACKPSR